MRYALARMMRENMPHKVPMPPKVSPLGKVLKSIVLLMKGK